MNRKKRRWGLAFAACVALALFLWTRELASWRPQKIGAYPNAHLVEDLGHGPWILTAKQLINVESGHKIAIPAGATKWSEFQFSPDGRTFAFSAWKGRGEYSYRCIAWHDCAYRCIAWHDCASGQLLRDFQLNGEYKEQAARSDLDVRFSADGKNLVVVADDGVDILSLDEFESDFFEVPNKISSNVLSRDARWLFVSERINKRFISAKIYDVKRRHLKSKIPLMLTWINDGEFSPDGTSILISDISYPKQNVRTWTFDVQSGRKLWDFAAYSVAAEALARSYSPESTRVFTAFSPDGQMLVDYNLPGPAVLRATRTGKIHRELPPILGSSTFAPDGDFLYCLDEKRMLWKIRVR